MRSTWAQTAAGHWADLFGKGGCAVLAPSVIPVKTVWGEGPLFCSSPMPQDHTRPRQRLCAVPPRRLRALAQKSSGSGLTWENVCETLGFWRSAQDRICASLIAVCTPYIYCIGGGYAKAVTEITQQFVRTL